MKIGIVPLTWGQFRQQNRAEWPEERILREVKQAGFDAVSSFPRPGAEPEAHLHYLADFGLAPAPGYFGGDFWIPEQRAEHLATARQLAAISQAFGLTEIFVAPAGWGYKSRANGKTRGQLAGHVGPEDGLSDEEWRELGVALNAIGAATKEFGVLTCIHNHAAQVIETPEECDRLMREVDPLLVFWGPDLGHLTFGGGDAVEFTRKYAAQIKALHLKDVVTSVREEAHAQEWDYGQAQSAGIWTELGQGCIDFPTVFQILREANYSGWILSEIDVTRKPTALQSATECREYLRQIGL